VRGTWLKTFCSFHGQQQLLSSFIHLMMERPSSFYGRATRVTPRLYGGLVLFFPFLFLFSLCMSHTDTGIHFRPLQIHSYFIWYKYCAINPSTAKSFSAKYYFLIQWSKHVLCRGPDLAHPTGRSTISRLACKIVSSYTRYTFAKNKYNIYTKQNKPKAFLSELSESAWCGP